EEPLDESSVKKMILTFEKRSYKNQELRIKFPDNPEKFMESELDLNDIIQEMHVVATMPDLYHLLVELSAVQSLLGLLGHDNTDILQICPFLLGKRLTWAILLDIHILGKGKGTDVQMGEHLLCAVEIVTAMEKPITHAQCLPVVERCAQCEPVVELCAQCEPVVERCAQCEPEVERCAQSVVDLLQELTDIDTLHESEEGAEVLIDALVDGQVVALLVQNLERLDESVREEADGVHNTLAIVENMAEFRPEMCTEAAQQGLLQWLLKRLKAKMPFDANKLYCSEVLAILLQDNDENRELLGELDGIDVLLQQLSVFKRHNPSTAEEQEMMENLFDALCSCLMLSSNRERFLKGEGLQLMNLMLSSPCCGDPNHATVRNHNVSDMQSNPFGGHDSQVENPCSNLREKKISRSSALKVLDHAMIGPEGTDNCHKFVDILGLRTIFPLFMKSPRKIKKVGTTEKEHE
ncbi:hypothetical protein STEG23_004679, partial [Scotinomys teguina]